MIARRLIRAAVRTTRRVTRPLRLRWIDYRMQHSRAEIERLLDLRAYLNVLEQNEHFNLVQLDVRRQRIVKWEV